MCFVTNFVVTIHIKLYLQLSLLKFKFDLSKIIYLHFQLLDKFQQTNCSLKITFHKLIFNLMFFIENVFKLFTALKLFCFWSLVVLSGRNFFFCYLNLFVFFFWLIYQKSHTCIYVKKTVQKQNVVKSFLKVITF